MFGQFLMHDAMRNCGLCCRVVSVRPSIMFIDSVETNKHTFEFFYHQVARTHTILVFSIPNVVAIFQRDPPSRGAECKGG